MKRKYDSGAEKKKKKNEEKRKIEQLPRVTSYFSPILLNQSPNEDESLSTQPAHSKVLSQDIHDSTPSGRLENDLEVDDEKVDHVAVSYNEGASCSSLQLPYKSETQKEVSHNLPSADPALWTSSLTNDILRFYWIQKGPSSCQNKDCDFKSSAREYKRKNDGKFVTRYLTPSMFTRTLKNGENVNREWLLFSPSQGTVYCFVCKLFSSVYSPFSTTGFNDWKHGAQAISEHENGQEHTKCMMTYCSRRNEAGRIDAKLEIQFKNEQQYWKEVLKRIVAVVKFVASRGQSFRGRNQAIGSISNGNYLGILELIGEFDCFLSEHLKKYGNPGKGHTSYLSADICEEFVEIIGLKVLGVIVNEVIKPVRTEVPTNQPSSHISTT